MFRLIYVSRIALEERPRIDTTLRNILEVSRARNQAANVTGLLLATTTHFAQALEGGQTAVETIYDSIARDKRHIRPAIIVKGPVEKRAFARWSMCAPRLSAGDTALIGQLEKRPNFDLPKLSDTALLGLLEAIARIHDAQQDDQKFIYV